MNYPLCATNGSGGGGPSAPENTCGTSPSDTSMAAFNPAFGSIPARGSSLSNVTLMVNVQMGSVNITPPVDLALVRRESEERNRRLIRNMIESADSGVCQ